VATSFRLDEFRLTYLDAGSFELSADTLFGKAPARELAAALERYQLDPDRIVFRVRSLLVETGANRVLIDPGGTQEEPGRLAASLDEAGIEPGSVGTVIVSHGHGDHYRGGLDPSGRPLFPNARYLIQAREWRHWLSDENPEPEHARSFRETLSPLEDRFTLLEGEQEPVAGIRCQPAPGHSPGQMVVRIGKLATWVADVLLSPVQVEHPDWTARFDRRPEQVVSCRRRLLRRLAADGSLALTCHFPDSGAGRVVSEGPGWRWQPLQLG
jgi:glyoxylase-like metal-dependent hydrolase (beta-lactamase superfamily II)